MTIVDTLSLIFTDYTLRTVATGAAVIGLISGTLGSYAVLRQQSLLGDAMSHAALPGVVVAFILTGTKSSLGLMFGAVVAGWLGTLLMMLVVDRTRIKQDAALGIVLSVFFGIGLVLLTWVQRQGSANQSGLDSFLFGRAAAMIMRDVWTMIGVGAVVLLLVGLFWKEFKLLSFDPDFAASLGYPVRLLDVLLTTLIVVAIVIGLQTVGVVLMSAMIVAPASAARQWTDRLEVMVLLSALFGAAAGIGGALISSGARGLPTGPTVVLCISTIVIVSLLGAPNRGLVWSWFRQRRNRTRLQARAVLETLYRLGLGHGDPYHSHTLEVLRATVGGHGIHHTLRVLSEEGLVIEHAEHDWSLTQAGVERVQQEIGPLAEEETVHMEST